MYTVKVSAITSTNFITNIPLCTPSGKWTATVVDIKVMKKILKPIEVHLGCQGRLVIPAPLTRISHKKRDR